MPPKLEKDTVVQLPAGFTITTLDDFLFPASEESEHPALSPDFWRHVERIEDLIGSKMADRCENHSAGGRRLQGGFDVEVAEEDSPLRMESGTCLLAVNIENRVIEGPVRGVDFTGAYVTGGSSEGGWLDFSNADLNGADTSNRYRYKMKIGGLPPVIENADLSNSILTLDGSTELNNCKLEDSYITIEPGEPNTPLDLSTVSLLGSSLYIRSAVTLPHDLSRCSLVVDSRANIDIDISDRVVSGANLSNILKDSVEEAALPSMQDLRSTAFSKLKFPQLDLSCSDLTGAALHNCDLTLVTLPQNLQGVVLADCVLPENALSDKNLHGATLKGLTIENLPTDLTNVTLVGVDLCGVDLSSHNLDGLTLVRCKTDEETKFPAQMSAVTFRDHQGTVAKGDYGRISWEYQNSSFPATFPNDVEASVAIGGRDFKVKLDNLDLSSYDRITWTFHRVDFANCSLPEELRNATLKEVGFEDSTMPRIIADSRLSALSLDNSDLAHTSFKNNVYGASAMITSSGLNMIPVEDSLDPAARRFFYFTEVEKSDLSDLIPQLAPETGKTYSLFWPRTSSPRHVHELHIRKANEDEWVVVQRDDEVRLQGLFLQEAFTFSPQEGLRLVDEATRSNRLDDAETLIDRVVTDLDAMLCARDFAGNQGPFMRITDDDSGRERTHYFCAHGLPF